MTRSELSDVQITVHLEPEDQRAGLRSDVLTGLGGTVKRLPPKWLYDERGCELFDRITALPEYYPTRAERQILASESERMATMCGADTLVELGSGTSQKTRLLLDALGRAGTLRRFAPFDVAEETLREAASEIHDAYPGVAIEGVVGDFERHLHFLPSGGRRLIAFLGGTIGNLVPAERARLLADVTSGMEPGDMFLVGTDLVKDRSRLVAAYDDAQGVTAEFNVNILAILNRELRARFVLERFRHVAVFDEDNQWIEMRLRSLATQLVAIEALELEIGFDEGEDILTEISAKFTPALIHAELAAAGLESRGFWTDPRGDFALTLAAK
ncbi:MAG: L-histidine N(alpha)-methyltransferase [Acidimicrobiales bacterium]